MKADDEAARAAREATIRDLFPLVRAIARKLHAVIGVADLDDLTGDGCIGLIRAVDRYDGRRDGRTLYVYAKRSIVGAMLNGIRRRDPVSERVRRAVRQAESRRFALAQTRMALPTMLELEDADPSLRRARVSAYHQSALSLDAPMPDGRDPLVDIESDPARKAVERSRSRALAEAIELLPERQRRVLALHYGDRELSLHAIGEELRISPQRASQLHITAIARLRRIMPAPP